jgi:hypothetical protein
LSGSYPVGGVKLSDLVHLRPGMDAAVVTVVERGAAHQITDHNIAGAVTDFTVSNVDNILGTVPAHLRVAGGPVNDPQLGKGYQPFQFEFKPGVRYFVQVHDGEVTKALPVQGNTVLVDRDLARAGKDDVDGGSSFKVNLTKLKAKAKRC